MVLEASVLDVDDVLSRGEDLIISTLGSGGMLRGDNDAELELCERRFAGSLSKSG